MSAGHDEQNRTTSVQHAALKDPVCGMTVSDKPD